MSNKLKDVIVRLQQLAEINPDAAVIIPGHNFNDQCIKTANVRRQIDSRGRQSYSDISFNKDHFNVILLGPEQRGFIWNDKTITRVLNKEISTEVAASIIELLHAQPETEDPQCDINRLSVFLKNNFAKGTIYYFDRNHVFTSTREMHETFPRLKMRWKKIYFTSNPQYHGLKMAKYSFPDMLHLFGNKGTISDVDNAENAKLQHIAMSHYRHYLANLRKPQETAENFLRRTYPEVCSSVEDDTIDVDETPSPDPKKRLIAVLHKHRVNDT